MSNDPDTRIISDLWTPIGMQISQCAEMGGLKKPDHGLTAFVERLAERNAHIQD